MNISLSAPKAAISHHIRLISLLSFSCIQPRLMNPIITYECVRKHPSKSYALGNQQKEIYQHVPSNRDSRPSDTGWIVYSNTFGRANIKIHARHACSGRVEHMHLVITPRYMHCFNFETGELSVALGEIVSVLTNRKSRMQSRCTADLCPGMIHYSTPVSILFPRQPRAEPRIENI